MQSECVKKYNHLKYSPKLLEKLKTTFSEDLLNARTSTSDGSAVTLEASVQLKVFCGWKKKTFISYTSSKFFPPW